MHLTPRRRKILPALALAAGLALGLGACGGSAGSSSASGGVAQDSVGSAPREAEGSGASAPDAAKGGAGAVTATEQKIIRRADISVLVKDVELMAAGTWQVLNGKGEPESESTFAVASLIPEFSLILKSFWEPPKEK